HEGWARRCDWSNGTVTRAWPTIRRAQCVAGRRSYLVADRHAGGRSVGHGRRGIPCDLCTVGRRTGPTVRSTFVLATPVRGNRYGRTDIDAVVGTMDGFVQSPHQHGNHSSIDGLVSSHVRWRHG